MKKCKYDFSQHGINAMYKDSLDLIFSVFESENFDALLDEININVSIGDKEITVPICADAFERLFDFLKEAEKEDKL